MLPEAAVGFRQLPMSSDCHRCNAGESAEAPSSKRDKLSSADEAIAAANATLAATDPSSMPASGEDGAPSKDSPGGTASMDAEEEEQQAAERRQSHAAAASRGTSEGPAFKEAEGSMREYRNDLEYLEDSFKLMIILLRSVLLIQDSLKPEVHATCLSSVQHGKSYAKARSMPDCSASTECSCILCLPAVAINLT